MRMLIGMLLIAFLLPSNIVFGQNGKDDLDFILKDDKEESKSGILKNTHTSLRFGIPVAFSSLPDSIKFSPMNSLGTGLYFCYVFNLTRNFSLALSPMMWFHKVGYKPSSKRVFPSVDSSNTLEKLRTFSAGLSVEIRITVSRDNKGRSAFMIAPGFEVDFPLVQTLKKNYSLKLPDGSTFDTKQKTTGIDIFYPYRYSAYLLIGHRAVGLRVTYWFTPWFKASKYDVINGIPVISETGSRAIPPVSQFEIGVYWGLDNGK